MYVYIYYDKNDGDSEFGSRYFKRQMWTDTNDRRKTYVYTLVHYTFGKFLFIIIGFLYIEYLSIYLWFDNACTENYAYAMHT